MTQRPYPYERFSWFLSACLLGTCQRGRVEISERELNGTCNSTCTYKSYFGPPKQGCTRIDNCRKKETGWKRFFAQCVPCICDCALSCGESPPHHTVRHKRRTCWTDVMWASCSGVSVQIHINVVNYIMALKINLLSFFEEFHAKNCFLFLASAAWSVVNTLCGLHSVTSGEEEMHSFNTTEPNYAASSDCGDKLAGQNLGVCRHSF